MIKGRSWRNGIVAACLAAAIGLVPVRPLTAQQVSYSASAGYSTGSFIFSGDAWSAAMFHGLSVRTGRFTLSASLPIIAQNNSALTYIGGVIVPTGGPDAGAVSQRRKGQPVEMGSGMQSGQGGTGGQSGSGQGGSGSGSGNGWGNGNVGAPQFQTAADSTADSLTVAAPGETSVHVGDPVFTTTVELYHGLGAIRSLSVHAFAKAPIASVSSGVGTGKWDYGGGASVAFGAGRTFVFADASYWVLGDMTDLELLDNLVYGVGVGRASEDGRWSLVASATGSSQVIRNVTPPVSIGATLGYRASSTHALTLGANFGLTESASQAAVTLGWRVLLNGER